MTGQNSMEYLLEAPGIADVRELSRLSLFGRVNVAHFDHLLSGCEIREYAPGEIILRKNQRNDSMYIIVKGRVSIHLYEAEDALAILHEGDTVGEMSVVGAQTTSAIVKADTHCALLVITQDILWHLVENDLEFARNLLQLFAKRLLNVTNAVYFSRKLQEEYKQQAHTDILTGLYNRRWLIESLPYEMSRCALRNRPLSLLAVDIDEYSIYNETHGYAAGDQLLLAISNALLIVLRGLDIAVRYEGGKIIIVLPGADINQSEKVAARVHHAIKNVAVKTTSGDKLPGATIAIGIAEMVEDDYAEMLIARANAALERAKQKGGNYTSR